MSLATLLDCDTNEIPNIRKRRKLEKKFMATKDERNAFSMTIETIAVQYRVSHIEAITMHCEETGLEIEMAAGLVNDGLKSKIEAEAQNLRYLPRGSKLPI